MFFTFFDLFLILIIFGFLIYGFVSGLVQVVGALIGLFVGAYLAGQFYLPLSDVLLPFVLGNENFAKVISFVLIFGLTGRIIGFIFYLLNKAFHVLSIIPFLKSFNRLAGALFGFVEGVLVLSLALYFIARFPFTAWLGDFIASSKVAAILIFVSEIFSPLLPELLKGIKTII